MNARCCLGLAICWLALVGVGCEQADDTGELSSRLTRMTVPDSPELARSLGCSLLGHHVGSSLGSLLSLSGGLDRFFEPDFYGEVPIIILARTAGWPEATEAPFSLDLYEGSQNEELDFVVSPTSQNIGGRFESVSLEEDGWFSVDTDELRLPVPILDDLIIYPPLVSVNLEGKFIADDNGFDTERLLLKAYLASDGIMFVARKIIEACSRPAAERPVICPVISNQITGDTPPEEAFPIIVSFMGGFDTRLSNGQPHTCDLGTAEQETDCNAVSVCMELNMNAEKVLN